MGVLSLQDCRVGKGKRDRRAAGHNASHGAPFCQLNYLILGWLWCTAYRMESLILQVKLCFTSSYLGILIITKVLFYLVSGPVCCWTMRAGMTEHALI